MIQQAAASPGAVPSLADARAGECPLSHLDAGIFAGILAGCLENCSLLSLCLFTMPFACKAKPWSWCHPGE